MMTIDWGISLYPMVGGMILLVAACFSWLLEKTVFAPGTAMLITWGTALVVLSFLPALGFYYVSVNSVFLYLMGAIWFSFIALVTGIIIQQYSRVLNLSEARGALQYINYQHLFWLCVIISIIIFPWATLNILEYGSNITEISYNIRRSSVAGEQVLNSLLDNLFVALGVLLSIFLFGVVQGKVKFYGFISFSVPYTLLSLIVFGRSGIVSLVLGWLVIVSFYSQRLKVRYIILPVLLLLMVVLLGGIWVKKFDVQNQSILGATGVVLEHLFDYLYQGPILFSKYLDGDINISTNWDFLNATCHLLSRFDLCVPYLQHSDFSNYGEFKKGNVYTIYFSILPHYGFFGLSFVFLIYAVYLASLFHGLKRMSLFSLAVYPYMFSAIILSVFTDNIGYSVYWQIKVFLICLVVKFFFTESAGVKFKN